MPVMRVDHRAHRPPAGGDGIHDQVVDVGRAHVGAVARLADTLRTMQSVARRTSGSSAACFCRTDSCDHAPGSGGDGSLGIQRDIQHKRQPEQRIRESSCGPRESMRAKLVSRQSRAVNRARANATRVAPHGRRIVLLSDSYDSRFWNPRVPLPLSSAMPTNDTRSEPTLSTGAGARMTAEQAALLKTLAHEAYDFEAFGPNLTQDEAERASSPFRPSWRCRASRRTRRKRAVTKPCRRRPSSGEERISRGGVSLLRSTRRTT